MPYWQKEKEKDSTLITTESGNIHAVDAKDWKWWHNSVPEKLKKFAQ